MIYRNVGFAMLLAFVFIGFHTDTLHTQEVDAETKAKFEKHAQQLVSETKARIGKRDEVRKQAIAAAKSGKFDEATRLLEQVYNLEESIFGPTKNNWQGHLN